MHLLVFTIAHIFYLYRRYRRRWRSREFHRARLRLLRTRQACLNFWYDDCFGMFALSSLWHVDEHTDECPVTWDDEASEFRKSMSGWMWVCMAMCWHEDGYDGSVVACQSYARLCDFSVKPYRSSTYHFLPCTTTCFPQGIWFSKLQTAFMVHTKEERPWWWVHGPGLKPVIRSGGMGVFGWDREGGTP